jgi:hypothetical protein
LAELPSAAPDAAGNNVQGAESAPDREDLRDQANRLWAHALHEDNDFMQRGNYFLVAESLLVVAYAALFATNQQAGVTDQRNELLAARVIAAFGFLLTVCWSYVARRRWLYRDYVYRRAEDLLPEYRTTWRSRPHGGPSGSGFIAFVVPGLAAVMWILLMVLA